MNNINTKESAGKAAPVGKESERPATNEQTRPMITYDRHRGWYEVEAVA